MSFNNNHFFKEKKMKKVLLLFLLTFTTAVQAINTKPFTIPELQNWKGKDGWFVPSVNSRVVYDGNDHSVLQALQLFAADYDKMFQVKLPIVKTKPRKGDFVFMTHKKKQQNKESYQIDIKDIVLVKAPAAKGIYWSTRTILQISSQHEKQALPKGMANDAPEYPIRGFMLDCGRKYFPMRILRQYVQMLSFYKMNTLHIHLNDNGSRDFFNNDFDITPAAFRLECDTYPRLTSRGGFYTKEEFRQFQLYADSLGVEIIPEFDFPAHSLAFTHYKPEIASKKYGKDHLDLFNPDTYIFLDALLKEYLGGENPVFIGKHMHIGTDEYSNENQNLVEKFRFFTDRYIRYAQAFGKKVWIWGQQTHAKGTTPIQVKDVYMQIWNNNYANPHAMDSLGYDIVSIPDWKVYIVPKSGYYHDYLDIQDLYLNWTPAHVGDVVFPERYHSIKGGMFAVWNDHVGNGISTQDIHYRFYPALQTIATKTWTGGNTTFSFSDFNKKRFSIHEAPGLNVAGYYPEGTILSRSTVVPGERLPIEQIGWNYNVSFDIDYKKEKKGTILFQSDDATFYLTDPISGFIGFSRDGYLYNFKYRLIPGENVHLSVHGDQTETSLWVNDRLISRLNVLQLRKVDFKQMNYFRTLVFPLKNAGNTFKSKISNLEVISLPVPTFSTSK